MDKSIVKRKRIQDPLTGNSLRSIAYKGFRKAEKRTLEVLGYNVVVKDGWVVKKYIDSRIEKIEKMPESRGRLVLD